MALPADWRTETLLTVAEAAAELGVSRQRVYELIRNGQKVPGVGLVRLEVVRCGWLKTSLEALDRFVERCTPLPAEQPGRTPSEARRASRRASERVRARLAGRAGG